MPWTGRTPVIFPLLADRVLIRPFHVADRDAAHRIYGDAAVMRYVAHGKPVSSDETAAILDGYIRHQQTHGFAVWALIDRRDDTIIGDIGFETRQHGVEFGYTLAHDRWGQGLATEAARRCLSVAFDQLDLPLLRAIVDPRNPASTRVLTKLGFTFHRPCEAFGRAHHEYQLRRGTRLTEPDGSAD